jgi:hypothetical protein
VTQQAYQRVTGQNPSNLKGANLPVENVNWDEAQAYCAAIGGRLPTEAEWEYAARAGSTAARYGNLDEIAWHSGNSGGRTHEVGQKLANAFGLFDMLGDVWQWTANWYGSVLHGSRAFRTVGSTTQASVSTLSGFGVLKNDFQFVLILPWCSVWRPRATRRPDGEGGTEQFVCVLTARHPPAIPTCGGFLFALESDVDDCEVRFDDDATAAFGVGRSATGACEMPRPLVGGSTDRHG